MRGVLLSPIPAQTPVCLREGRSRSPLTGRCTKPFNEARAAQTSLVFCLGAGWTAGWQAACVVLHGEDRVPLRKHALMETSGTHVRDDVGRPSRTAARGTCSHLNRRAVSSGSMARCLDVS